MRQAYKNGRFHCYYSGVQLDTVDSGSPFYRSIDQRTPGQRVDLVLTALFINKMKGDLDEDEFRDAVTILADSFRSGRVADFSKIAFTHRKRNWLGNRKER